MRMYQQKLLVILSSLWLILVSGCFAMPLSSPGRPAKALRESDLVGIWYVNYEHKGLCDEEKASRLTEVLILEVEGKYRQIFWDKVEGKAEERKGQWWLELLPDGGGRVHLEGGRSYPQENCDMAFWEVFQKITGLEPTELGIEPGEGRKEAVLEVKGASLAYPPVGDPDGPRTVRLRRLSPR